MPKIHGEGVLGTKVEGSRRELDTFKLPRTVTSVTYTSDEVTSVCPITGQPDWYTVSIDIADTLLGIESKSLKLYLQSFREEGMFAEEFAHRIGKDVLEAIGGVVRGQSVRVDVYQKARGGISIAAHSFHGWGGVLR